MNKHFEKCQESQESQKNRTPVDCFTDFAPKLHTNSIHEYMQQDTHGMGIPPKPVIYDSSVTQ
jgi:hypothetical protein